ncbi:MAG: haloacid dehalogenase-like hydrolase, partial [Solirubrobacteraceae bacterium]|nr:haloacid dehalogenase-like hydrolase [Solirubrobacteraceae bacterium]
AASAFAVRLASRADRVVHQAVDEVRALQASGHLVVVATACEERLARAYLDAIGLGDVAVAGSRLTVHPLKMRVEHHNHGVAKIDSLLGMGIVAPWAAAYTDALSDLPLLRGAERPVLVNPDGWLRGRVSRSLGRGADEVVWLDPPARVG